MNRVLKSAAVAPKPLAVDAGLMRVTCVVSTPRPDHQGDVLVPAGLDTSVHRINPVVFYDHRRHHPLPIGKAQSPDGAYTVRAQNDLVVADTYFARSDPFAEQVFKLVEQDVLRGVSVGFAPVGAVKVIGRDPSDPDRPACRYDRWQLHEYSHTPAPTNPEALTVALEKGRWHPLILKSLAPFALKPGTPARPTSVRVPRTVGKAMNDDALTAPPVDDTMPPEETPPADDAGGDDVTATAKAAYDCCQMLTDGAAQIRDVMSKGEHVKGKAKLAKLLDELESMAGEAKAIGDMVTSDVGGAEPDGDEAEPEPGPVETADDGEVVIKSRATGAVVYHPRRFTAADLAQKTKAADPAAAPAPAHARRAVRDALATLRRAVKNRARS